MAKAKEAPPTLESSLDNVITSGSMSGNGTSTADLQKFEGVNSVPAPLTEEAKAGPKQKYHISCHPNTPLAFEEFDVEAASETEAEHAFFEANQISATHAPRFITRVG